jgi:hypothetical protein
VKWLFVIVGALVSVAVIASQSASASLIHAQKLVLLMSAVPVAL